MKRAVKSLTRPSTNAPARKREQKASPTARLAGDGKSQHPCGPVIRGLGVVDRAAIEVSLKVVRRLGVRW